MYSLWNQCMCWKSVQHTCRSDAWHAHVQSLTRRALLTVCAGPGMGFRGGWQPCAEAGGAAAAAAALTKGRHPAAPHPAPLPSSPPGVQLCRGTSDDVHTLLPL